ncbi:DNA recombination protein RmuC [Herbiconiux sp. YIM B11900]|uniref:DNA recombination protein RmuC n=1 Tax=Herbiconiux sp. YIM B11900 TaxID=3404131 RepID=UPI003F872A41
MDALLPLLIGLVLGLALGVAGGVLLVRARHGSSGGAGGADAGTTASALEAALAERTADLGVVRSRVETLVDERASLQSQLAAVEATAAGLREQAAAAAVVHREQAALAREQAEAAAASHRDQSITAREQFDKQFAVAREQSREQLAQLDETYRAQIATLQERIADLQGQLTSIAEAEKARKAEDSQVLVALSPVQESLKAVQAKVVELETQRQQQYGELSEQLRSATESEERLRSTAESLASALRSNSTRGVWGETQLRSVVEAAGLIERVDFDVQTSIVSDSGAGRPDMVVHLPGGKNIAVDAKVPFDAYLEASAIQASATGVEGEHRTQLMKKHVKALRDHITALGTKGYWNGLEASPELVIAFIPSESLVSSALEADPSIMEFAFGKRVALASPVTLWSVLKTVAFSWQQDVLTQEARQLFDLSQQLYTRLGKTATHIDKLGRTIDRTVKDYNSFIGSFERQVFPTARKLGALSSESLFPELGTLEETPREIAAHELLAQLESDSAPAPAPASADSEDAAQSTAEGDSDDAAQRAATAERGRAESETPASAGREGDAAKPEQPSAPILISLAPPLEHDDDEETDAEREAAVERAVAELDALGGAARRDARYLESEQARTIELELNLDDDEPTGTTPR